MELYIVIIACLYLSHKRYCESASKRPIFIHQHDESPSSLSLAPITYLPLGSPKQKWNSYSRPQHIECDCIEKHY